MINLQAMCAILEYERRAMIKDGWVEAVEVNVRVADRQVDVILPRRPTGYVPRIVIAITGAVMPPARAENRCDRRLLAVALALVLHAEDRYDMPAMGL